MHLIARKVILRINGDELERHTKPFRRRLRLADDCACPFFPFVAYALARPDKCGRDFGDVNNRQPLRNASELFGGLNAEWRSRTFKLHLIDETALGDSLTGKQSARRDGNRHRVQQERFVGPTDNRGRVRAGRNTE